MDGIDPGFFSYRDSLKSIRKLSTEINDSGKAVKIDHMKE